MSGGYTNAPQVSRLLRRLPMEGGKGGRRVTMDAIRSGRERLIQTLCFETLGVIVVTPLLALVTHAPVGESLLVLAALSLSVMRSEERRVGKECRARWWPCHGRKNRQR